MDAKMKPANSKAWALLKKLQALADRGIDGEKISAQNKIARLKKKFDFNVPEPEEAPDLFSGNFKRSSKARRIYSLDVNELDVANAVKYAIVSATNIPCVYRDGDLLAEASPSTVNKLTDIAGHIANSFRALLDKFNAINGVTLTDRSA